MAFEASDFPSPQLIVFETEHNSLDEFLKSEKNLQTRDVTIFQLPMDFLMQFLEHRTGIVL